jgi:hypothetical protein
VSTNTVLRREGTSTETIIECAEARELATRLLTYPIAIAALRIRSRSGSATLSGRRNARDTVMLETPTLRATSSSVTRPVLEARVPFLVFLVLTAWNRPAQISDHILSRL